MHQEDLISHDLVRRGHPLTCEADLDPFLRAVGDSRIVLLGEASHGTHEYYQWRAKISKHLIEEKGFNFIAVEGDWPDCYEVNRYIKGHAPHVKSARDALKCFRRWPTWIWANWETARFIQWLHDHNKRDPEANRVGFYGLDVYSLWDSLRAVVKYLTGVDPSAATAARRAYQCFEPYGEEAYDYAHATAFVPQSCENEVADILVRIRAKAKQYKKTSTELYFSAEQNALVAKNAEEYYRTMLKGDAESWNVRDHHMTETLERLMDLHGPRSKGIVWAHNTHVGDARATDMARDGMINIGQLARQQDRDLGVVLAGFGTYQGSVIAARSWDAPMMHMEVPPAAPGSWEHSLHELFDDDRYIDLFDGAIAGPLNEVRGQRAIGVVYSPLFEHGNYVPTSLAQRYDAFFYLEHTRALKPFHLHPEKDPDFPETFPSGL